MKRVRKLRIYPSKSQITLINDTLGCCRYVQNLYIEYNIKEYEENKRFLSGYDFAKIVNQLKKTEEKSWISKYSSKAIKDAIMNEEKAFKSFFKKKGGYPKFKSRKKLNKESFFFIKDGIKYPKKNIIKLPILGRMRITENDYLPPLESITSGRIIKEYGQYYVMFIYDTKRIKLDTYKDYDMGIDVGIKSYATIYCRNGYIQSINHFKDLERYKELDEKLTRLQQIISYKAEINYGKKLNAYMDKHGEEPDETTKRKMKGESYASSRIRILRKKVRALNRKKNNIRQDFIYKLVDSITAKTKPNTITIENLDISEMIKHTGTSETNLHKYISESSFYKFKIHLIAKCVWYAINLRAVEKYFASSKICCVCGHKKKSLTLVDRIYKCDRCGNEIDRDLNAAVNLLELPSNKCTLLVY